MAVGRLWLGRGAGVKIENEISGIRDKDTGEELIRPEGYGGRLYCKVTSRHKDYLKALGDIGTGRFVDYRQWIEACETRGVKTNQGKTPQLLSPPMIYGVFASRGSIEVQKDKQTGSNLYWLTERGKIYLESL